MAQRASHFDGKVTTNFPQRMCEVQGTVDVLGI